MLALLFVAALGVFAFNILRLVFKGQRKSARRWLAYSGPAAIVILIAFTVVDPGPTEEDLALAQAEREQAELVAAERAETAAAEAAEREAEEEAQRQEELAAAEREAAACRTDVRCYAEAFEIEAAVQCRRPIERLAQYQHEWTDRWYEPKLSRLRWRDQEAGVITFVGDRIRFQNGFGAWQNHIYECDFDTTSESVLDVRARPGML